MEASDINNSRDMERFVEGCLNDLMEGISTKDETMVYFRDYTLRVIDITAEICNKPPKTEQPKTAS
jgi:hypothetical protein